MLELQLLNVLYCTADLPENAKKKKTKQTPKSKKPACPSETQIREGYCLLGNVAKGVQEICYILTENGKLSQRLQSETRKLVLNFSVCV